MNVSEEKRKKVLIFSLAYIPRVGGAELAMKEITDRIDDIHFDMITMRFDKDLPKGEKIGNIIVHRIFALKLFFPFTAFFKAIFLHRKYRYDIAWALMANRAGFASLFFKLLYPEVKFLLTLQEGDVLDYPQKRMGIMRPFLNPFFKNIFKKADYIQAISAYLAAWSRKMGYKGKLEIIPNGVDMTLFKKLDNLDNIRSKLEAPLNYIWLITTSRLVEKNGIEDIIKSLKYLDKKFKLFILGIGPLEKRLKEITKDLKLEDRVKFLGQKDIKDIPEYINVSKIFIRPSLSEGLGSSFLEAMAVGIPVIGTKVGGIPDFLQDPSTSSEQTATGLFCEVRNPKSIAKKVMEYINNPKRTDKIVENAQKLVRENYDWNLIVGKMKNIFHKLS